MPVMILFCSVEVDSFGDFWVLVHALGEKTTSEMNVQLLQDGW